MAAAAQTPDTAKQDGFARLLTLEGIVGPASADYLVQGIEEAADEGAGAILIRIDTPGGLDTSMREIIRAILRSPVPVVAWVGPDGARAASAGTYIVYASHVAAMAPATNLGAATPVAVGGGLPGRPGSTPRDEADGSGGAGSPARDPSRPDAAGEGASEPPARPARGRDGRTASERKAVNDAVAYIRALAETRGRNADWAESAVRDAVSLSARAALEAGVIDLVAPDARTALDEADGRLVDLQGREHRLETRGLRPDAREPGWRTRILATLANPNIALILMMIGVYGLFFEFLSPGALVPGVVGAICLVVGLYSLAMLPLDYAGVALMVLGLALVVAEAFVPSFGVLGIGGVAALVIGTAILVDVDGVPAFEIAWPMLAGVALAGAGLTALVATLAVRSFRAPVRAGEGAMLGQLAEVLDWSGGAGHVRAGGERWQAQWADTADNADPPAVGDPVTVVAVRGLTLIVEPGTAPGDKQGVEAPKGRSQ